MHGHSDEEDKEEIKMEDIIKRLRDIVRDWKWKEQTVGPIHGPVGRSYGTNFLNKETGELLTIKVDYPGSQTYPEDEELDEMFG